MDEKLVFIRFIGEENDGYYAYELMFSNNIEKFEIEKDNDYCCLCQTIIPATKTIIHKVKMKIKLSLIQDNCCFSFKHSKLGIVALAYENIDNYDEYPDDRIILFYGDEYDDVERKLALRNILIMN